MPKTYLAKIKGRLIEIFIFLVEFLIWLCYNLVGSFR